MKIGIISDTHNHLDPQIAEIFRDVSHILHAGDVGMPWILLELEQIAPVTAVLGNTDAGITLRETEVRELSNRTFLIQHIVDPSNPSEQLQKRVIKLQPDVVVFGHTHRVFHQSTFRQPHGKIVHRLPEQTRADSRRHSSPRLASELLVPSRTTDLPANTENRGSQ
jgi:putative phosphoesterase